MENRRLLFAALLSALILIVWNVLFPPTPVEPPGDAPEVVELGQEAPLEMAGPLAESEREPSVDVEPASGEEPSEIDFGQGPTAAEIEEYPVLDSGRARVEFTNRGAQLKSFLLPRHLTPEGEPVELVRTRGTDPYPFALVDREGRSHRLNGALFTWSQETGENGQPQLRFLYQGERGAAEKVFRLTPDGLLEAEVRVSSEGGWSLLMGPGVRNPSAEQAGNRFLQRGVGYRLGAEAELLRPEKQEEERAFSARGLRWVTIEDNYFLIGVIPGEGVAEVRVQPVVQRAQFNPEEPRFLPLGMERSDEDITEQMLLLEAASSELRLATYFGAKRYSRLAELPYGLEESVRFGWFGALAKPLYYGLEWIYVHVVANYGWAIVLITLLIKLVFFPLTHKSQESMGKMQELNPKVQAVRARYRSKLKDRQGRPNLDAQRQMNEEVMKIYKSAGVNPASGCLPVLLQLPVFYAFFRLLSTAVELRNAPWIGWIDDLSSPDPYFVLPVLMGVTSLAMQRIMPASPDPMQRRMMQLMPIVFTFFAFAFPSGLVLYWVTNNILTMGQQAAQMKFKKRRAESAEEDGGAVKPGPGRPNRKA